MDYAESNPMDNCSKYLLDEHFFYLLISDVV